MCLRVLERVPVVPADRSSTIFHGLISVHIEKLLASLHPFTNPAYSQSSLLVGLGVVIVSCWLFSGNNDNDSNGTANSVGNINKNQMNFNKSLRCRQRFFSISLFTMSVSDRGRDRHLVYQFHRSPVRPSGNSDVCISVGSFSTSSITICLLYNRLHYSIEEVRHKEEEGSSGG